MEKIMGTGKEALNLYRQIHKLNEVLVQKLREYKQAMRELERSQSELQEKNTALENFYDCVVGRELKLMELEREVAALKTEKQNVGRAGPPAE